MLALFFVFDWRLGLACLAAVVISLACMFYMMGGRGMDFMTRYMESLVKMNKTGTEYVRGIPVVKVFQQTVYSFRAFHDAIEEFTRLAQDYAVKWCKTPQSLSLTVINGIALFLVPAAILVAPGEGDFARFVANFAFYAIFSAVDPHGHDARDVHVRSVPVRGRCREPRGGSACSPCDRGTRRAPDAARQRHPFRGRELHLRGRGDSCARPRELRGACRCHGGSRGPFGRR